MNTQQVSNAANSVAIIGEPSDFDELDDLFALDIDSVEEIPAVTFDEARLEEIIQEEFEEEDLDCLDELLELDAPSEVTAKRERTQEEEDEMLQAIMNQARRGTEYGITPKKVGKAKPVEVDDDLDSLSDEELEAMGGDELDFGEEDLEPAEESTIKAFIAKVKSPSAKAKTTPPPRILKPKGGNTSDLCLAVGSPTCYLFESADLLLSDEEKEAKRLAFIKMVDDMRVKVANKAVMLLSYLNKGAKTFVFFNIAVKYITENPDNINKKDFNDFYLLKDKNGVKGYDKGTAAPQHINYINLFLLFKILLPKVGGGYSLNPNSILLEQIKTKMCA